MTQEEEKRVGVDRGGGNSTVSRNPPLKETLCNCVACCNKRCAIIYMYLCYLHAVIYVVITCVLAMIITIWNMYLRYWPDKTCSLKFWFIWVSTCVYIYIVIINLCLNHCFINRENASTPEVDRDAHITQSYWMEIRHIVRCIYRDSMSLSGEYSF